MGRVKRLISVLTFFAVVFGLQIALTLGKGGNKVEQERKCAYCIATAEVLSKRVANEKPRNHLDYRGRLDGDGTRWGKILDFRLSELRIIELLEDLSNDLDDYSLLEEAQGSIQWQHKLAMTGNATSLGGKEHNYWKTRLKNWCDHTLEAHEDAVTKFLRSDAVSSGGIEDLLCHQLTHFCPEKAERTVEL